MRKKSLRGQLQRAFLVMLVPLVVVTAVGGALLKTSHEQKDSTSQRVSSAVVITDLLTRLAESGRTLSSLVLLRQRGPLVAYLAIAPALDRDFARVVAAASPEAVPTGRIALAAWRNLWHALQGVELRTRGPALRIDQSVLVLFAQVAENAVISSQHLDQIAANNARELQRLLDSGLRREQLQELLLLLSAALGLVAGVAAAHRLHRRLRRQLDDLSAAAARLGSDPDPPPVPLGETSELRVVGKAFNEMLQRVTESRAKLADSERRFRSLVQNSSDVIILVDPDTVIRYLSPSARPVIGVDPDAYPGRPLSDLLDPQDVPMMLDALLHARHASSLPPVDCRLVGVNGSPVPTETLIVDLTADPAVAGFVLTSRDVRERRGLEDQLRHQAFHDELTGLPNRALLRERLTHRLSRRAESTEALVAVLFIDLDDFKTINDSLGHGAGDSLLRTIGHRISGKLRPADTAARVGGDEFIVLLEDLTDRAEAHTVAARLLTEVRQPITLHGRDVFPRASLGIAIVPPRHVGPEEVLAQADMAMYHAKADAGGIAEYQPVLAEQARHRLSLKTELQQAIDRYEFELHYQPVIDLDRRLAVGAEALVRWRHPERGLLLPAEFLPLCEETEMILLLGTWVLQEACRQAAAWAKPHGWEGVSVNVPVRHVIRPGFPQELTALLAESQLPANQLILELTESALAHEQDQLSERLQAVRQIGVRLAIDDFGREYSSLNRLRNLTVDILKIDKSLVDEVDTGGRDAAIAGAIIDLSSALGLETVAEGVERPEQADALQSLRCERAQGFFFSRPVPPSQLTLSSPAGRATALRSSRSSQPLNPGTKRVG